MKKIFTIILAAAGSIGAASSCIQVIVQNIIPRPGVIFHIINHRSVQVKNKSNTFHLLVHFYFINCNLVVFLARLQNSIREIRLVGRIREILCFQA